MKTYITAFIILLSLSLFFRPAMAQSPLNGHSGLYLTADDDRQTTKELHTYRWLEEYCPNVTYTFKTEDSFMVGMYY